MNIKMTWTFVFIILIAKKSLTIFRTFEVGTAFFTRGYVEKKTMIY